MASLDPSGLIGRINVGDTTHCYIFKYISSGLHGFREEDFFPIISLWVLMTSGAWPVVLQGLDWQDLCRGQLNIAT